MKITLSMLKYHKACHEQLKRFDEAYPGGVEVTEKTALCALESGFDVIWLIQLLPKEGPGSRRDFAWRCAERALKHTTDHRVIDCVAMVGQKVANPASVSDDELAAARAAAKAAARDAARDAAMAAARAAAWDAAWDAARDAARDAAWDAARDAARDAAIAAAMDAAMDAEREWQVKLLVKMLLAK